MTAPEPNGSPDVEPAAQPSEAAGDDAVEAAARTEAAADGASGGVSEPEGEAAPDGHPDAEAEQRLKGMPEYKGEPLDAERGPGLGCFWIQIALLSFFLVFTPLTLTWGWDPFISGALLIFTLVLLLFSGQTVIFLLRLVAADRRTRRTSLDPGAKPTVGQMEDAGPAAEGEPTGDEESKEGDKDEGGT